MRTIIGTLLLLATATPRTFGWITSTPSVIQKKTTTQNKFHPTDKHRDSGIGKTTNRFLFSNSPSMLKMSTDNNADPSTENTSPVPKCVSSVTSNKPRRKLYTFEEARRIARGHGFQSYQEFLEYDCAGAYQLPKDADVVWAEEWKGWDDFLGTILSFEEGREVARGLKGVNGKEDYLEFMKKKEMPEDDLSRRLPYRPDLFYKEEWNGWDNFLDC